MFSLAKNQLNIFQHIGLFMEKCQCLWNIVNQITGYGLFYFINSMLGHSWLNSCYWFRWSSNIELPRRILVVFFHCQIASNKTILFMHVLWVNIVILHSWRKRSIHPLTVKTCQNCAIVFFFAWYYQYNCKKLFPYLLHDLERIKTYLRTIDISQLYNLPTSRGVPLFKELIEQL